MLTYQRPAARSPYCADVSVACPTIGFALAFVNGITTPALAPGPAGPWMWPAVAAPERPVYVTFQVSTLVFSFSCTSTMPVAAELTGGTSAAPLSLAS